MKLIIGLGNPGPQYALHRHNVGFLALDELAHRRDCPAWKIDSSAKALITSTIQYGEKLLLVKPQTFMNLSGQTVSFLKSFYKLENTDILLIHDDIDLASDTIRYKFGGSSGGQNGVKNTIEKIGTDEFARIKIGIGRPSHPAMSVSDHVLSNLSTAELDKITLWTDQVLERLEKHFFKN